MHDELVFEAPEQLAEAAIPIIKSVMAKAAEPLVQLSVPIDVEAGVGRSWGAAH